MIEDKYLTARKKEYALKIANLKKFQIDNDFLEYLYKLLSKDEITAITNLLRHELQKLTVDSVEGKRVIHPTRKARIYSRNGKVVEKIDMNWVQEQIKKLEDAEDTNIEWEREIRYIFMNFPQTQTPFKDYLNKTLSRDLKRIYKSSQFKKNLDQFRSIFKLSAKELDIITFLYLDRVDGDVDSYLSSRQIELTNVAKSVRYFCRFFNLKADELRAIFSKDSTIMKAGIVIKNRRDNEISLSENVTSFLGGLSRSDLKEDYVKKIDLKDVIELKDHNVASDKIETMVHLLESNVGSNLLLYGHPGTGKTEFAKALAKKVNKKIYFVNQADNEGDENLEFKKQAIVAAHNIIESENSIIVVDECDPILNIYNGMWMCETKDGKDRKAWINDFLENTKHKVIWISNRVDGIDESTKRRFSYSVEFLPLSTAQRKKVWETQVKKQSIDFLSENDINELAKNLRINSGGITLALKDIQAMNSLKTKEQKLEILKTILTQHQVFTSGEKDALMKKSSKYELEILNTDYSVEDILSKTALFFNERKEFKEKGIFNINILLHGPPGTGKTEFVKHLAEMTDRELIIKRVSDIRSKWYGESVRNIAASFKEARENNSILFFDEADTFFGNRESANEYHGEETNEFLTQMENFEGLLICATNFTQRLDQASMRRFNYKVKFDYLKNDAKCSLFRKYFSELTDELQAPLEDRLRRIPGLTPGDFKVVYQKNAFQGHKCASELISELEAEVSYKKEFTKKVGLN